MLKSTKRSITQAGCRQLHLAAVPLPAILRLMVAVVMLLTMAGGWASFLIPATIVQAQSQQLQMLNIAPGALTLIGTTSGGGGGTSNQAAPGGSISTKSRPNTDGAGVVITLALQPTGDAADGIIAGTPAFDSVSYNPVTGANAGLSSGDNQHIVRTFDPIQYNLAISVQPPAGPNAATFKTTNVTVSSPTLPASFYYLSLPTYCKTGNDSSGVAYNPQSNENGGRLTCNLGTIVGNYTASLQFGVYPNGFTNNGFSLPESFTAQADSVSPPPTTLNEAAVIVTSAPNFVITKGQASPVVAAVGSDGTTPGVVMTFGATINRFIGPDNQQTLKGTQYLSDQTTFTDSVAGISPNALLYTWGGNSKKACTAIGNSGQPTVVCTQPGGAGTPISITLSGLTTASQYIASDVDDGSISIWLPQSDLPTATTYTIANTYTNFAPTGLSGTPNIEPTTSNTVNYTFYPTSPGTLSYSKYYSSSLASGKGTALTEINQNTAPVLFVNNSGSSPFTQPIVLCDKLDTTKEQLTNFGLALDGQRNDVSASAVYTLAYSTKPIVNQVTDTCNNNATDGPFYPTTAAATASQTGPITRFRVTVGVLPSNTQYGFYFNTNVLTSQLNTTVINFESVSVAGGGYDNSTKTVAQLQDLNQTPDKLADRLEIGYARIGTFVDIDHQGPIHAAPGSLHVVQDWPDLVAQFPTSITNTTILITDTIPAGLTFVYGGSGYDINGSNYAQPNIPVNPVSVVVNPDRTTTVVWILQATLMTTQAGGLPACFDFLSYKVRVNNNDYNGQVLGLTTQASSPIAVNNPATSTNQIIVDQVNSFATQKRTTTPFLNPGDSEVYELDYTNLSNSVSFTSTDIIDVLPYNGDGTRPGVEANRVPPSNFAGTSGLTADPVAPAGTFLYYTSADPTTISSDPTASSNQPSPLGSTTQWCTAAQFGTGAGCPASYAATTAFRAIGPALAPNSGTQTITTTLATLGNSGTYTYTNSFGTLPAGLLPVISNDATDIVLIGNTRGTVYLNQHGDAYYNQIPANQDLPIGGVVMTLTGHDKNGNAINQQVTTATAPLAANTYYPGSPALGIGDYLFWGLPTADATGYSISRGPMSSTYADTNSYVGSLGGNQVVVQQANGVVQYEQLTNVPINPYTATTNGVHYDFGVNTPPNGIIAPTLSAYPGTLAFDITAQATPITRPGTPQVVTKTVNLQAGQTNSHLVSWKAAISYVNSPNQQPTGWLALNYIDGNLLPGNTKTLNFTVTAAAGMSAGTYTAVVTFSDETNSHNNTAVVNVTLTVTSPPPPASITYSYYLPFVANGLAGGFTTQVMVQNVGDAPATFTAQYYDAAGTSLASPQTANCGTLAANAACVAANPLANGTRGTGVIVSSQPLSVLVQESTPYGSSAYAVHTGAASTLVAPLAINNSLNFNTQLTIANVGTSATSATVTFYDQNGNALPAATKTINLTAHSSQTLDQTAADSGLPNGFYGWARIVGPTVSQLVAQVLETRTDIKFVALASAEVAVADTLYAPAIFNNAFGGFSTGANIVNPNPNPVNVTITYYDKAGHAYPNAPFTLAGNAVAPVYQGGNSAGLPNSFYGSATVSASGGGNIVMVVNEAGNTTASGAAQSGTYSAAAVSTTGIYGGGGVGLPVVANGGSGGLVSGATILNTSDAAVSGTISYYNQDGTALDGGSHSQNFTIAAHASLPVYQGGTAAGLPSGFVGQAVVTQSGGSTAGSLIVTTNVQNDSLFYTYTF